MPRAIRLHCSTSVTVVCCRCNENAEFVLTEFTRAYVSKATLQATCVHLKEHLAVLQVTTASCSAAVEAVYSCNQEVGTDDVPHTLELLMYPMTTARIGARGQHRILKAIVRRPIMQSLSHLGLDRYPLLSDAIRQGSKVPVLHLVHHIFYSHLIGCCFGDINTITTGQYLKQQEQAALISIRWSSCVVIVISETTPSKRAESDPPLDKLVSSHGVHSVLLQSSMLNIATLI